MTSLYSSRAPRQAKPPMPKRVPEPDEENQVIPFHLDDGTDDIEEIRRRRYSSSASSASDSDAAAYAKQRGRRPPHKSRHRSSKQEESEWDKASTGERESVSDDSDADRSDDEEPTPPSRAVAKRELQPESPRRTARKKTQQSESESDQDEDEEDDEPRKQSSASVATVTTGIASSSPSTPRTITTPADFASLSKLAVFPGSETELVQGYVLRTKSLLHSQYQFFLHDRLVLMAEKQSTSRTPNYHLFDMTRAATGLTSKLSKKSGNYLGKLRSNFSKKKSVLIGNHSRKTELGAVIFSGDVSSSEPRQVTVVLPPLNAKRQEVDGIAVGDEPSVFSILVEHYKSIKKKQQQVSATHDVQVFSNKQPVFENGFYRLNFHGRVSVPSVKNFQLIPSNTGEDPPVCLQFGKVDDNKFHLDFRAPITPTQAFAIALAQLTL